LKDKAYELEYLNIELSAKSRKNSISSELKLPNSNITSQGFDQMLTVLKDTQNMFNIEPPVVEERIKQAWNELGPIQLLDFMDEFKLPLEEIKVKKYELDNNSHP
jgi:hypothetical protein